MHILELAHLNREQFKQVQDLQQLVYQKYRSSPPVYWHIVRRIRPFNCNILCYLGPKLVGFISRFLFHPGEAELCLLIHPDFETNNYIRQMIWPILKYIPKDSQKKIIIPTAHEHKPLIRPEANWALSHHSYYLKWQGPAKKPDFRQAYMIDKASLTDYPEVIQILKICFPQGTEMTPDIFNHILSDNYTKLYTLKHHDQLLGLVQVNQEGSSYRISDLCILPEYQGQHLGAYLLKTIIYKLFQRQKPIALEVDSHNAKIFEWYQRLGFKLLNTRDFWYCSFQEIF
jgi:ribosomal protein S18 acetylase RimI-like enzyme